METILRGSRKGEQVEISQWCNDWVSLQDGKILSPTSLRYTEKEFKEILEHDNNGMMFLIFEPDHEKLTFRKKKL